MNDDFERETDQGIEQGVHTIKKGAKSIKDYAKKKAQEKTIKSSGKKVADKAASKIKDQGAQVAKNATKKAMELSKKAAQQAIKGLVKAAKLLVQLLIKLGSLIITLIQAITAFIIANIIPILIGVGIACVVALFVVGWNFITNTNTSDNNVYQHELSAQTGEANDQIYNAWAGLFYEKFADQSMYMQLQMPDEQDLQNEVNVFSGKTYEELGGKSLNGMIQSGTQAYKDLGIRDINNYENQIKISSGMLSVLDQRLNAPFKLPENFVRPVLTTCTNGEFNGNVDFDSCEIILDEENGFKGNPELTQKYGIGSLVNYKAYLQPSRIVDYGFKTIEVWDEQWQPGDSGSPVKLLNVETMDESEVVNIIEKYKRGGTETYALSKNMDGTYSTGYYQVNNTITYKDWQEAIKKSSKGSIMDTLLGFFGNHEKELGLYNDTNKSLWGVGEPGISSGVPETTIAYAITNALTMYGKLDFTVNQTWVDGGVADHTQTVNYLRPFKDYELDIDEDAPLSEDENVKTYKAIYDGNTLKGYMEYNAQASYTAPKKETTLLEQQYQPATCDVNNPISPTCKYQTTITDGSWEYDIIIDASGNKLEQPQHFSVPVTEDDPDRFTFAPAYNVEMQAVTEGKLQTYTVVHADASVSSESENAAQYLEDYIQNYQAITPDESYPKFDCYSVAGGLKSEGSIDSGTTLEVGEMTETVDDPDKCNGFAIQNAESKGIMREFHFNDLPEDHFAKIANALGFSDEIYNDISSNAPLTNEEKIVDNIGKINIALPADVMDTYGELLERYGGAYGIDPNLLSLIISQEYGICEGDYYNGPDDYHYGSCNVMQVEVSDSGEDITAYNFTLRESTSEENSKDGKTFFDLIRQTTSKGNVSDTTTGNVAVGGIETFNVNSYDVEEGKDDMSGVEVSIKVGAMKLQAMLERYNYNVPMAIQAYNYGGTAMDAVLDIYEQQTGITKEMAIENPYELGWFHYTTEVHNYPKDYVQGWNEDTLGDELYLSHVMGRNSFGSLYAIRTPKAAQNSNVDANTLVSWNTISATDTIGSSMLGSGGKNTVNSSNVARAYYRMTQNGSTRLQDTWGLLTAGQKSWDAGIYLKNGQLDLSTPTEGGLIKPEKTYTDTQMIIKTALSFGSELKYGDFDIADKAFWTGRFSGSLGVGGDSLNSSLDPDKVFGTKDVVYPIPDYEEVKGYGANYIDDVREVVKVPVIKAKRDAKMHSIMKGTVDKIERIEGRDDIYLTLIEGGKEQGLIYDTVTLHYYTDKSTEILVSEGDVVETYTDLASISQDTQIWVEFICDGSQEDALGLVETSLINQTMALKYINMDSMEGMELNGNKVGNETDFSGTFNPGSTEGWIRPTSGSRLNGTWYYNGGGEHRGMDLVSPMGTPIYAPANGVILNTANGCPSTGGLGDQCGGQYGGTAAGGNSIWMVVEVKGALYGVKMNHLQLDSIVVSAGQAVMQGEHLGNVGSSGNSSGAHLHIEITDLGITGMDVATYAQNWNRDLAFGAGWSISSRCEIKAAPCRMRPESVFGDY